MVLKYGIWYSRNIDMRLVCCINKPKRGALRVSLPILLHCNVLYCTNKVTAKQTYRSVGFFARSIASLPPHSTPRLMNFPFLSYRIEPRTESTRHVEGRPSSSQSQKKRGIGDPSATTHHTLIALYPPNPLPPSASPVSCLCRSLGPRSPRSDPTPQPTHARTRK